MLAAAADQSLFERILPSLTSPDVNSSTWCLAPMTFLESLKLEMIAYKIIAITYCFVYSVQGAVDCAAQQKVCIFNANGCAGQAPSPSCPLLSECTAAFTECQAKNAAEQTTVE